MTREERFEMALLEVIDIYEQLTGVKSDGTIYSRRAALARLDDCVEKIRAELATPSEVDAEGARAALATPPDVTPEAARAFLDAMHIRGCRKCGAPGTKWHPDAFDITAVHAPLYCDDHAPIDAADLPWAGQVRRLMREAGR